MGSVNDVFKIPHDVTAEQVLIAAAMQDQTKRSELLRRIRPEHFIETEHALAWSLIMRCDAQGHEPSAAALSKLAGSKLDRKYLEDVVAANRVVPKDLRFYVEAIQWDVTRARAVQGPINELLKAIQDPGTTPERVRALSKQIPIALQGGGTRPYLLEGKNLVAEQRGVLNQRRQGLGCFPTGIAGLDCYPPNSIDDNGNDVSGQQLLIPGLEPGKITTITGISGGGKSTITALIVLEQARICAAQGKGKVLYGWWEGQPQDGLELMASISCGIQRSRVRTGRITDAELKMLCDRMDAISEWVTFVKMPFHRERGVRHKPDDVLDQIHGYIADTGASLAVFDLWLRAFRGLKDESDTMEALVRQETIADETKCHCILIQQQRLKEVETRDNPIPTREGIKGSSAWVDVSDTILGVYMPGLMKRVSRNIIQLLVLKQRFGLWPLTIEYTWDGDLVKLSDPRLVWDVAIGNESRVQGGGASSAPSKKRRSVSKFANAKAKKSGK